MDKCLKYEWYVKCVILVCSCFHVIFLYAHWFIFCCFCRVEYFFSLSILLTHFHSFQILQRQKRLIPPSRYPSHHPTVRDLVYHFVYLIFMTILDVSSVMGRWDPRKADFCCMNVILYMNYCMYFWESICNILVEFVDENEANRDKMM